MSKNTKNPIETTNTSITLIDEEFPQTNEERLPFDGAAPVKKKNLLPTPRLLREDEIECRIGTITDKGLSILLYKTARTDIMMLDETYGAENWQRKQREENGHIVCSLWIRDPYDPTQWIVKEDVGTESNTDPVKGGYSDSLKRAAVNLQIGVELYSAPWIWIPAEKIVNGQKTKLYNATTKNGKPATYDNFVVEAIRYDENRRICALAIRNADLGVRVFTWYNEKAQMREDR